MKRYTFKRSDDEFDIRVIESYADYTELDEQFGYELFSITKL